MIDRRQFVAAAVASLLWSAAASEATILYADRATRLDQSESFNGDLWVRQTDLSRVNDFEVKPEGACREDLCIPLSKDLVRADWFNLTGFARKTGQAFVRESSVWSFGEIPVLRGAFFNSRTAPDFAVPDRRGKIVHLKDFRGKKVLVITWASW